MRKFLLLATMLTALPLSTHAEGLTAYKDLPGGIYKLDPTHASLTWKVSHMGLSNYTARFTKMDATLNFDPKDPAKSTLVATVDPMSVKTDYPNPEKEDFDAVLAKGDTWFNAGKFPEIKFESTKIERIGDTKGKLYGNLTFLGVTKPLVLDVTFNGGYTNKPHANVPGIGFSASGVVKRSDWGMNNYVPMIGDDVTVLIETEFNGPAADKK